MERIQDSEDAEMCSKMMSSSHAMASEASLRAAGVMCPRPASDWAHQHFYMDREEKHEAPPLQGVI